MPADLLMYFAVLGIGALGLLACTALALAARESAWARVEAEGVELELS